MTTAIKHPDRAATRPGLPAAARGTSDRTPDTHAPAPQPRIAPIPAALVLDGAANLIAEHGWCQRRPTGNDGALCAEYALYVAARLLGADDIVLDGLLDALGGRLGEPVRRWNDTPGRIAADVTGLLRACAVEARTT